MFVLQRVITLVVKRWRRTMQGKRALASVSWCGTCVSLCTNSLVTDCECTAYNNNYITSLAKS